MTLNVEQQPTVVKPESACSAPDNDQQVMDTNPELLQQTTMDTDIAVVTPKKDANPPLSSEITSVTMDTTSATESCVTSSDAIDINISQQPFNQCAKNIVASDGASIQVKCDLDKTVTESNSTVGSESDSKPDTKSTEDSSPAETIIPCASGGEVVGGPSSPISQSKAPVQSVYHIKWIRFRGQNTPVVTQNENGPCPLLAIMNVLLLRGLVKFPPIIEMVTSGQLMDYLGDCIFEHAPKVRIRIRITLFYIKFKTMNTS